MSVSCHANGFIFVTMIQSLFVSFDYICFSAFYIWFTVDWDMCLTCGFCVSDLVYAPVAQVMRLRPVGCVSVPWFTHWWPK